MQFFAVAALAGLAAATSVMPGIKPPGATDAPGCSESYSGSFEISVAKLSKRDNLVLTLENGILMDNKGRYGYIAANYQFQFDNPIQDGALYTGGWSVCSNGSLAIGGDSLFYECLSGSFYNLYDKDQGAQCDPIEFVTLPISGAGVSQQADGQPTAASAYTSVHTVLCQITDGQVQQNTCLTTVTYMPPVTQIGDGQIQAPTGNVITQIGDGQIQAPTGVVTQITDGQIQAPTGVVTQITDGQIQAPTGKVVTQITDGQVQAPTGVVTQITDGQIQAPTGVVTQITDGQIQAPTGVVTQISDGQPQAPTSIKGTGAIKGSSTQIAVFTGAAAKAEIFGLAAGLVALAAL